MAPALPYDVLLNIFERVLSSWPDPLPPSIRVYLPTRGGDVQACALVCRDWRMPAQHVLFQNVNIGQDRVKLEAPTLLLRTLIHRPDLAVKVRIFRAGETVREPFTGELRSEPDITRRSLAATQAMGLCKNLRHVSQGPIAARARPLLYSTLRESGVSSLDSLDLSDPQSDGYSWTLDIAQTLALPDLRRLELRSASPKNTPNHPIAFLPCRLTFLRLDDIDLPSWTVTAILLSVGPTLKKLSMDSSGMVDFPAEEMRLAWAGMVQLEELTADAWLGAYNLQLHVSLPPMLTLRRLCTTIYELNDDFLPSLPPSLHTLHLIGPEVDELETLKASMYATLKDPRWPLRPLEVTLLMDDTTEYVDLLELQVLGRSKGVTFEWVAESQLPPTEFIRE